MIHVNAWGKEIGKLINDRGALKFKYSEDNLFEFSPIKMPNNSKTVYSFSHLSFQYGLPGLISDHLPGSYGMDYMNRFIYKELGRMPSILEKLQFLGSHTVGALEFVPSMQDESQNQILNIKNLYEDSKKILMEENEDSVSPTLKTLLALSNSAGGGARAKALVGYNRDTAMISLTKRQGDFPEGFLPAIIKYDDQDISMYPMLAQEYKTASIPTKLEYIYHLMAKKTGLIMSPCELLESDGRSHFLTYRFDKRGDERFHMHSFSGMMHFNPQETEHSYTDMLRVAQKLNLPQNNKEEIVKVVLFNAIFGNRDDHTRNFSFLMNKDGKWAFAPAYDLTYTSNGYHQMLLNVTSLNRAPFQKLVESFAPFGISSQFLKEIIEKMIHIKHSHLESECINHGIPKSFTEHIFKDTKIVDELFLQGA
jgi:serine/threonine-protein kinase HipA